MRSLIQSLQKKAREQLDNFYRTRELEYPHKLRVVLKRTDALVRIIYFAEKDLPFWKHE